MSTIYYKIDILSALKEAGYSTYKIRKEKLFSESTLQKFRNGEPVSWENLSTICELLDCQPGDILDYIPDSVEERILELTEKEEQELRDYYFDQWGEDDSYEERVCLEYEEYLLNEIEKIDGNAENEDDHELAKVLYEIVQGYYISRIERSWPEIEKKYGGLSDQIHEFFDSYIEEFNDEMKKAKEEYIEENVERELEEAKYDIQAEALKEYLGGSEK